ncbi:hypothetical protein [Tsuneonella sp. HG222]
MLKTGHVGEVTFTYDAEQLVPADVEIAIPPDGTSRSFAVKLLPATGPHADDDHPAVDEPGLTLALLERPYKAYADEWSEGALGEAINEATIDGAAGITVEAGVVEGMQLEYTLVPVGSRALLVSSQSEGATPALDAAIAAVVASIDLPG